MRYISILALLFSFAASAQVKIYTADIHNFYIAFDSLQTTKDTLKQQAFLQRFYFDKASPGLQKFIELDVDRNNEKLSPATLLRNINANKDLYVRKRTWITSTIESQKQVIETKLKTYKQLYPGFIDGDIVFVIGREIIGGKPNGKDLLIGAELMASENSAWAVPIVLHEYTHTQQWMFKHVQELFAQQPMKLTQILANAIWEGNADFMAEKVYGTPLEKFYPNHYNVFGYANEKIIWEQFKLEMFSPFSDNKQWFYADKDFGGKKVRDIGYFMGNQICKAYYNNATNKKQAIAEMIDFKLDSDEAAFQFLKNSGYATRAEIEVLEKRFAESKKQQ